MRFVNWPKKIFEWKAATEKSVRYMKQNPGEYAARVRTETLQHSYCGNTGKNGL